MTRTPDPPARGRNELPLGSGRLRFRARLAVALAALCGSGLDAPAAASRDGGARPLRVAVAANFRAAFEAVAEAYPRRLAPAYGSSGLLHAQITQGRPFDVFLSADRARPQALVDGGLAFAPMVYAEGRLALLVNRGTPGPDWLASERRVAIANPDAAPYGRAAVEALADLGRNPARVVAANVAQAFHFVASGGVDGGFVALAQLVARNVAGERYWLVPQARHAPIEQVGVVVRGGDEVGARAFLAYLAEQGGRATIRAAGYR